MPRRKEVPELENMMKYGRKKFVRYEEGAKLYSMGLQAGEGSRCDLPCEEDRSGEYRTDR